MCQPAHRKFLEAMDNLTRYESYNHVPCDQVWAIEEIDVILFSGSRRKDRER